MTTRSANDHPFLNRIKERGTMGSGRASEKRVAQSIAARLTANSGAGSAKGDMTKAVGKRKFRMEAKSTKNLTLAVDLGWLVKISVEAQNTQSAPAITLSFTDEQGKARANGDWVAIPLYLFRELIEPDEA